MTRTSRDPDCRPRPPLARHDCLPRVTPVTGQVTGRGQAGGEDRTALGFVTRMCFCSVSVRLSVSARYTCAARFGFSVFWARLAVGLTLLPVWRGSSDGRLCPHDLPAQGDWPLPPSLLGCLASSVPDTTPAPHQHHTAPGDDAGVVLRYPVTPCQPTGWCISLVL